MTIDEVKEAVSSILNQRISTQLYLILKDDQTFTMRIADMMEGETTQELQKIFKDFLEPVLKSGSCVQSANMVNS